MQCFELNQIPDKNFLEHFRNKNGIYFISQEYSKNNEEHILIKIGVATYKKQSDPSWPEKKQIKKGLESRLDSYLLYYPRGYYIYSIITCNSVQQAKNLEQFVHNFLSKYKVNLPVEHTHGSEWFELRIKDLYKTIDYIKYEFKENITACYRFNPYFYLCTTEYLCKKRINKEKTERDKRIKLELKSPIKKKQ
jgi:hypothetical protein